MMPSESPAFRRGEDVKIRRRRKFQGPGFGAIGLSLSMAAVATATIAAVIWSVGLSVSFDGQSKENTDEEGPTLYLDRQVPAIVAMEEIISSSENQWERDSAISTGAQSLRYAGCDLPIDPIVMTTTTMIVDGASTGFDIAVLPPGTGAWSLEGCDASELERLAPQTLTNGRETLMRYGDVLVTMGTTDSGILSIVDSLSRRALSECIDIDSTASQITRSPLSPDYIGLTKTVSSSAVPIEIPTPDDGQPDLGFPAPSVTVVDVRIPNVPDYPVWPDLPAYMAKPVAPEAPTKPSASYSWTSYEVDTQGPGCGWAFTDSAAPDVDAATLAVKTEESRKQAESEWDAAVQEFDASVRAYWSEYAEYLKKVEAWNNYVNEVNEVSAKWDGIEEQWKVYRKEYADYEAAMLTYEAKMAERENIRSEWEAKVARCEAIVRPTPTPTPTPTSSPSTSPVPTPTPTPTPTRPATIPLECHDLSRPSSLDLPEPTMPVAPTPPPDPRP